jgi:hypothetical protein
MSEKTIDNLYISWYIVNCQEKQNTQKRKVVFMITDDNRYLVQAQVVKNFRPREQDLVTWVKQGEKYVDIRFQQRPAKTSVKRIDKTHYKVIKTGEIKEYKTLDEKAKSKARKIALSHTFQELRWLIRTNFTEKSPTQLFITLTYAQEGREQPTHRELYKDFKNFMERLRAYFEGHNLEYIVVFEPQGNGWFHSHLMLKTTNRKHLSIPKEKLTEIWRLGSTTTQRLKSSDVGSYYVAYFTDLIDETYVSESDMTGNEKSKARIKGGRLQYYPKGFNMFRCSRGITRPTVEKHLLYGIGDEYDLKYEKAYEVTTTDQRTGKMESLNKLYKATYKRKED